AELPLVTFLAASVSARRHCRREIVCTQVCRWRLRFFRSELTGDKRPDARRVIHTCPVEGSFSPWGGEGGDRPGPRACCLGCVPCSRKVFQRPASARRRPLLS